MNLTFHKSTGAMSDILGVDPELMVDLDCFVNSMQLKGASLAGTLLQVQETFELDENETAAFMFYLGYMIAKNG